MGQDMREGQGKIGGAEVYRSIRSSHSMSRCDRPSETLVREGLLMHHVSVAICGSDL